jgi:hypothetical protein
VTFKERIEDWWETVQVKWFMLDAQQKQAIILLCLYLSQIAADIVKSYIVVKVGTNESGSSE